MSLTAAGAIMIKKCVNGACGLVQERFDNNEAALDYARDLLGKEGLHIAENETCVYGFPSVQAYIEGDEPVTEFRVIPLYRGKMD